MPDPLKPIPETPPQPQQAVTVNNGMFGWIGQVAQMTAVGFLMVLTFYMYMKQNEKQTALQNDTNDFHTNIYQHLGREAAKADSRDQKITELTMKLDAANSKLDRLEWYEKFRQQGFSAFFHPESESKK